MVLADRGFGLVQVVAAGVADAGMNTRDTGFRLLSVVAELHFSTHRLLSLAQLSLMSPEATQWHVERAIRQSGEADNPHVDAGGAAVRHRLLDLPLGRGLARIWSSFPWSRE